MLAQMADWIAVNGEAIYGTRPWTTYGEGPVRAEGGAFKEDAAFTAADVRFTTKGETLYAFVLGWPKEPITIRALGTPVGRVSAVRLLGHEGALQWSQEPDGLRISAARAPPVRPCGRVRDQRHRHTGRPNRSTVTVVADTRRRSGETHRSTTALRHFVVRQ